MKGQISNFSQIAYARRITLEDGKAQGLKVIDCDNGKIRFLLNESRALDIMQVYHEGQNVSFVSKNGFNNKTGEFLSRFEGGMLYTCGLDAIGGMEGYDIHGSFHLNSAQIVRVECSEQGIVVEADVYSTSLFGANLKMRRKIFSAIGSETVSVEDTLYNLAYLPQQYCLLYHVNVGYPMLDEGAQVIANAKKVIGRNDWSCSRIAQREKASVSIDGQEETCYFLEMNEPNISLVNKKIQKKFTLSYSKDTLPSLIHWHSMASGDYAMGFEPSTSFLDDKFSYKTLGAGEKVSFNLNINIEKI